MNTVKELRNQQNFTQAELAEKSGLSLRTIQRIESGVIPKGYTLKALSTALQVNPSQLTSDVEFTFHERKILRLMNLSIFGFFVFPFGNILFPLYIWRKNKKSRMVHSIGAKVINMQILWSFLLCVGLSMSPFLDRGSFTYLPLILVILFIALIINACIVTYTAYQFQKGNYNILKFPVQFL